jgi:hypothetical protein
VPNQTNVDFDLECNIDAVSKAIWGFEVNQFNEIVTSNVLLRVTVIFSTTITQFHYGDGKTVGRFKFGPRCDIDSYPKGNDGACSVAQTQ